MPVQYLFGIAWAYALGRALRGNDMPVKLDHLSAGFLCIEKIAYHLQDPFKNRPSDITITDIAKTIETNTRQLLGEVIVPVKRSANEYYIM